MPRVMYDATDPRNIPADAQMVAGYLDGIYAWPAEAWASFPGAVRVGIVVKPDSNNGHVLDVEQGNAGPGQAPGWVQMRRRAGCDPTVYCNRSTWPAVRQAFALSGVTEPHYWLADPDDGPNLQPGTAAVQWGYHGTYDESIVADWWPGVDNGQTWPAPAAAPVNPPPPAPVNPPPPPPAPDPAPAPEAPAQVPPPVPAEPAAPVAPEPATSAAPTPVTVPAYPCAVRMPDGSWHLLTADLLTRTVRDAVASALAQAGKGPGA